MSSWQGTERQAEDCCDGAEVWRERGLPLFSCKTVLEDSGTGPGLVATVNIENLHSWDSFDRKGKKTISVNYIIVFHGKR